MAYKVSLDLNLCQGYANCLIEAPAIFDFDEDTNKAILLEETPSDELRAQADASARGCPARAIAVEDIQ